MRRTHAGICATDAEQRASKSSKRRLTTDGRAARCVVGARMAASCVREASSADRTNSGWPTTTNKDRTTAARQHLPSFVINIDRRGLILTGTDLREVHRLTHPQINRATVK